jgi:hypothetical protein
MPSAADVFTVLHLGVLTAFVGGTAAALLVAIRYRLRIRRPLLVWYSGPFARLPLGPTLFLGAVAGGFGIAELAGYEVPVIAMVGYPGGGLLWFAATWLVRTVVVTDYGLVPDVARLQRAVAWSQIVDYVETSRDRQPHFTFVYRDDEDAPVRRLDLPVPASCVEDVRELVQAKLDVRFRYSANQAFDEEILDPPRDQ